MGESATFSVQALGTSPLSYQWLKNGTLISGAVSPSLTLTTIQKPNEADYSAIISNSSGSVTSAVARLTVFETIPDLYNTGVNDLRAPAADGLADLHYALIQNADTNSTYAIIEDSTVFPIVEGPWLANTATSKWIGPQLNTVASAVGTYVYRTTINLTDRDPSTVVIIGRWSTDNAGTDIRVNGVSTGNPRNDSFAAYTPFTIYGTNFVAGTNTLDFVVENLAAPGYTGLRVEIIRSNVRIPPGVPPEILTQPVGQTVAEGESVTFTSDARGTSPLSYQWLKNGAPIAGQTTTSLSLANVTTADSGTYALFVVQFCRHSHQHGRGIGCGLSSDPGHLRDWGEHQWPTAGSRRSRPALHSGSERRPGLPWTRRYRRERWVSDRHVAQQWTEL